MQTLQISRLDIVTLSLLHLTMCHTYRISAHLGALQWTLVLRLCVTLKCDAARAIVATVYTVGQWA